MRTVALESSGAPAISSKADRTPVSAETLETRDAPVIQGARDPACPVRAVASGTRRGGWQNPLRGFPGRRENRDIPAVRPPPPGGPWRPRLQAAPEAHARSREEPRRLPDSELGPLALARRSGDQASEMRRRAPEVQRPRG